MKVILKKDNSTKETKVGFSWTTLFFGFFPAMFRGDTKGGSVLAVWYIIKSMIIYNAGFAMLGVIIGVDILLAMCYNKTYIEELLRDGYEPASRHDEQLLRSKGISIKR